AVSKCIIQRGGVLVSRSVRQRRTDGQILKGRSFEEHVMAAKYTSVVLVFAAVLIGGATAMAQQVGTATAVNPSSESTPPGGSTIRLTVGARVVHKERIHTSPTGTVQRLFVDQITLIYVPNTYLWNY